MDCKELTQIAVEAANRVGIVKVRAALKSRGYDKIPHVTLADVDAVARDLLSLQPDPPATWCPPPPINYDGRAWDIGAAIDDAKARRSELSLNGFGHSFKLDAQELEAALNRRGYAIVKPTEPTKRTDLQPKFAIGDWLRTIHRGRQTGAAAQVTGYEVRYILADRAYGHRAEFLQRSVTWPTPTPAPEVAKYKVGDVVQAGPGVSSVAAVRIRYDLSDGRIGWQESELKPASLI